MKPCILLVIRYEFVSTLKKNENVINELAALMNKRNGEAVVLK